MLQNIKELYGDTIAALDGDIGHVKDFYFDDKSWVVRYVVVDTGSWLTGRLVLLAPHIFAKWDLYENKLHVKAHKRQVEHSPPIEARHLQSARTVTGYPLQAADGTIGRVTDLMVDDKSWAIRELVVETGHWYAGRVILISPKHVERIDLEESKMLSSHTQADFQRDG